MNDETIKTYPLGAFVPVGEEFRFAELPEVLLRVVEKYDCVGCFFDETREKCAGIDCCCDYRDDSRNVIFEKLDY